MTLSRRGLLAGLLAAPAVIRTPGLLMPILPPLVMWRHAFELSPMFEECRLTDKEAIIAECAKLLPPGLKWDTAVHNVRDYGYCHGVGFTGYARGNPFPTPETVYRYQA